MIESEIIKFVSTDATVVARNTRLINGQPVPESSAELQARARSGMIATMQELMLIPNVQRSLMEEEFELTTTSATEYELPALVGRVLGVRRGTDSMGLRMFESIADFRDWFSRVYGVASVTDSDEPAAAYISGHRGNGELNLTISPGTGSQTTLTLIIIRDPGATPTLTQFKPSVHNVILIGTLNFASGGAYAERWDDLKQAFARSVDPLAGGEKVTRHARRIRRGLRRTNASIQDSSASAAWPAPWVKDVT
jgi:hypothetical protein